MASACAREYQTLSIFPTISHACKDFCPSGSSFDITVWTRWTRDNWLIPWSAIAIYAVFLLRATRGSVRVPNATMFLWNVLLGVFSIFGARQCLPHYASNLVEMGWTGSLCMSARAYSCGDTGVYITLFIYSKLVELGDTIFLILKGRAVSFLHAYHHITVLLFCWHSFSIGIGGAGLLYAAVNYSIHALMYSYYAVMSLPFGRKILRGTGIYITTLQIVQMIVGIFASITTLFEIWNGGYCFVSWVNSTLALIMYASYAYLFMVFYRNSYMKGEKAKHS